MESMKFIYIFYLIFCNLFHGILVTIFLLVKAFVIMGHLLRLFMIRQLVFYQGQTSTYGTYSTIQKIISNAIATASKHSQPYHDEDSQPQPNTDSNHQFISITHGTKFSYFHLKVFYFLLGTSDLQILGMAFSFDAKYLLIVKGEPCPQIVIWDLETRKKLGGEYSAIQISPNKKVKGLFT